MITIRRLCDCTLQDVILAWNEGFEGYFVKMNFSLEQFLKRLVHEELSAEHSILLYDGDTPVGIVLNGMREIDGKKLAWNGGTGIAPAYRNKGLGRLAIAECIRIYEEEGVESATLEAIAENHPAIGLYEKMGYKTIFWSFAYADWDNNKQMSHDKAKLKILENIHNGEIMLLHPTSSTNASILPEIIQELKRRGYRFGSLDEL